MKGCLEVIEEESQVRVVLDREDCHCTVHAVVVMM